MQEKESNICISVREKITPSFKLFIVTTRNEPRYRLKQMTLGLDVLSNTKTKEI